MRLATEVIRDQDEKVHAKVAKRQVRDGTFYLTFDLPDVFFFPRYSLLTLAPRSCRAEHTESQSFGVKKIGAYKLLSFAYSIIS